METVAIVLYVIWWLVVLCIGGYVFTEAFRAEPLTPWYTR